MCCKYYYEFLTTFFVEEARAPQPGELPLYCRFTIVKDQILLACRY